MIRRREVEEGHNDLQAKKHRVTCNLACEICRATGFRVSRRRCREREIRCSTLPATPVYRTVYAPMIREFITNERTLATLDPGCFAGAVNLCVVECRGVGLRSLGSRSFAFCDSIPARLDFPHVDDVSSGAFTDSLNITELHFSEANEAVISALSGFSTAFGAENAAISFDL